MNVLQEFVNIMGRSEANLDCVKEQHTAYMECLSITLLAESLSHSLYMLMNTKDSKYV